MYEKYPIVLAVTAFINKKGKILIIKKSPLEQIDPGLWTVPGGKVKPEEPIIDALTREVEEEVGLRIKNYEWIGEDVFIGSGKYFHAQHFLCEPTIMQTIKLENKLEAFSWILKKDIKQYTFPINIKKRLLSLL